MRYRDTGNVHKDFHLATHRTVNYVLSNYGMDFLRELFRRTAQDVYRSIWEDLKKGDIGQLVEHWEYYYGREKARFEFEELANTKIFHVLECPYLMHLKKHGVKIDSNAYLPTILINEFWSEQSPFTIETIIKAETAYDQIIQRRA